MALTPSALRIDGSYWALRPMHVLSLWLAVDPSGPENGGMQVVRVRPRPFPSPLPAPLPPNPALPPQGSHRDELSELVDDRTTDFNVLGARTHTDADLQEAREQGEILDLILSPGVRIPLAAAPAPQLLPSASLSSPRAAPSALCGCCQDVAIFHPNIIHGSPPNHSSQRRAGLTIRYSPPSAECTDPEQPVMMLRGEADPAVPNVSCELAHDPPAA